VAIKELVRQQAGHRCIRCFHPYKAGDGEWSACDSRCLHGGPYRWWDPIEGRWFTSDSARVRGTGSEAQWRILTVHHLNGIKHDCRWWNLVSLCQRCHLTIQAKVRMERPWTKEHSEWFKPYVAGYYAWSLLGEELTREETMARLEELLALQHSQDAIPGFPQTERSYG
jgi:hypothetical protein